MPPRKAPLQSRTPLESRSEIVRRVPLNRASSLHPGRDLTGIPPVPAVPRVRPVGTERERLARRRPVQTPEERRARRLVRARAADGRCEGCRQWLASDYAHRIARSQGGIWSPSNALALCSDLTTPPGVQGCHSWTHANPEKARDLGWMLRRSDDPLTAPACLYGIGWVLLHPDGSMSPYSEEAA